jgi:ankyrin repeat protein
MLRKYIRYVLYLYVFIGYSVCYSGSYEDFFIAIKQDNALFVSTLLERGFDPNTLNSEGENGLILALREPSMKVVSVLVAHAQTNVEFRTTHDESPLMLAAIKGFSDVCAQLIARDADVNKPGWTPLHYAATAGSEPVVRLLLEHHAYIDASSPNESTPLMMAAMYGNAATVKLLLDAGADPGLKNALGMTAIDFANKVNKTDSADLISAAIRAKLPKGTW